VAALRRVGASVYDAASVGRGFPDLVVGFRGRTLLLEIKRRTGSRAQTRLRDHQRDFFDRWRGEAHVVYDVDDALKALGAACGGGCRPSPVRVMVKGRGGASARLEEGT
jgi:hypothetical protein